MRQDSDHRCRKVLGHISAPLAESTLLINSVPMIQGKLMSSHRKRGVVITPTRSQRELVNDQKQKDLGFNHWK